MPNILIIEDEANIRMFVSANLTIRGYNVREADSGTRGLNLLREAQPDALILDILLPDMMGWDVLRAMAAEEALRHIPVVIMTASVDVGSEHNIPYDSIRARLTKPVGITDLLEALRKALA